MNLVEERKSCFTENYLVFSLNEKMPQLTSIYLEKEDEALDYCRTVNFNRNFRQSKILASEDDGALKEVPEEIDGDEKILNSGSQVRQFELNQSMFINEGTDKVKRYSIVANDSSFKAYTKDNTYDTNLFLNRQSENNKGLLTVTLKDLAEEKNQADGSD